MMSVEESERPGSPDEPTAFEFDVFLSYPRHTAPWKKRIERDLQERGLRCFSDSRLRPGDSWSEVLESGLHRSRVFLVLWSSEARDNTNVNMELGAFRALMRQTPQAGRRIIAVFLDGREGVEAAPDLLRTTHGIIVSPEIYDAGPEQRTASWDYVLNQIAIAASLKGGGASEAQPAGLRSEEDAATWALFSDQVRQVLAFAAASESNVVGTRALLFGVLMARDGRTPLVRLLDAAGYQPIDLIDALVELPPPGHFRPEAVVAPTALRDLPRLTPNAWNVLDAAAAIARTTGSELVTADHLLGALLRAEATTAYAGLLKLTGSVELVGVREVFTRYLSDPTQVDLDREFRDAIMLRRGTHEPAMAAKAPEELENLTPATALSSDQSTLDDALDHRLYADAIAHFIRNSRTRAPLAIGIKARWGAGKTSTMRMVRVALDPDAEAPFRDTSGARLPIWELLRKTRKVSADAAAEALEPNQDTTEHRTTIWFNAWKYQSSEQIWAGLAHAILTQIDRRLTIADSDRLWASLQVRRTRLPELRRRVYRYVLLRALPYLLAIPAVAAIIALFALVAPAAVVPSAIGGGLVGLSSICLGLATGMRDDVKRAAPQLVEAPDYDTRVGYLHLVDSDLRRILKLAGATPQRPFVVFIDDLDRCGYRTVAEVIEALNVFLAGGFDDCIFVIAMEPDLIAAQIHAAYESLFKHLGDDGHEVGWRFLEKMIQLPLSLPSPTEAQLTHYVDRLTGAPLSSPTDGPVVGMVNLADVEDARNILLTADDGDSIADIADAIQVVQAGDDRADDRVLGEAALREFDERFDGSGAREIILRFVNDLSGNPREIKRFVNVFRFYAYIDLQRQIRKLPPVGVDGAAKLAQLAVSWPSLLTMLTAPSAGDQTRAVLTCLEEAADDDAWAAIAGATPKRLLTALTDSPDLREAIAREPKVGMHAASFI